MYHIQTFRYQNLTSNWHIYFRYILDIKREWWPVSLQVLEISADSDSQRESVMCLLKTYYWLITSLFPTLPSWGVRSSKGIFQISRWKSTWKQTVLRDVSFTTDHSKTISICGLKIDRWLGLYHSNVDVLVPFWKESPVSSCRWYLSHAPAFVSLIPGSWQ